ncbi:MAG: cupin domain-containing protein [Granulicella sp.]
MVPWIEPIEFIESENSPGKVETGAHEGDEYFDLLPNNRQIREGSAHMTTEGFAIDGTMLTDFVQLDLAQEMLSSEQSKPWQLGHTAKTLFKKADFRTVLISMEKGSTLKEHHADGTISVQVLKGSVLFTTQGKAHTLQANSLVTLGASIKHQVEALEESAFLLTIAWPNTEKLQTMKHRGYGT